MLRQSAVLLVAAVTVAPLLASFAEFHPSVVASAVGAQSVHQ